MTLIAADTSFRATTQHSSNIYSLYSDLIIRFSCFSIISSFKAHLAIRMRCCEGGDNAVIQDMSCNDGKGWNLSEECEGNCFNDIIKMF